MSATDNDDGMRKADREREEPHPKERHPTPEEMLNRWVQRVNSGRNASGVVDLYAEAALLWATFASDALTTPEGMHKYFSKLVASGQKVCVDEESLAAIALGNDRYILTGKYVFAASESEQQKKTAARFTFVFDVSKKRPILHHHSSVIPPTR